MSFFALNHLIYFGGVFRFFLLPSVSSRCLKLFNLSSFPVLFWSSLLAFVSSPAYTTLVCCWALTKVDTVEQTDTPSLSLSLSFVNNYSHFIFSCVPLPP
ncbi:Hypothetical predicted protein [Octopus vulgaris]|uniref:Uncharacterized protein n=1 Tax=Octopus vulgaris TaxID=6645 RepID=A0AA36FJI4_OCTVU|nr:Hypothetical predicted protein [Octopus vulgaris]